jgi:MinD superfamily P-loop ATPase
MPIKQLVVISWKGGTGKTGITAAFASLADNKVMADTDVDAADLHILLHPIIVRKQEFRAGKTAKIIQDKCIKCGKCLTACRFEAVQVLKKGGEAEKIVIDPVSCEGCGFCYYVCPVQAVSMEDNLSGEWYISDTKYGPFVHAKLGIAEENSGKLVTVVRENAKKIAEEKGFGLIIIDGPPGIGCPVISSISGADGVLIVTEPTLSGKHDMIRVIDLARHFHIKAFVTVNKYDLNPEISDDIEAYCKEEKILFAGKIPFDPVAAKALVNRKSIIEYSDGILTTQIRSIWKNVKKELDQ